MLLRIPSLKLAPLLIRLICLLGFVLIPASMFGQGCVVARGGGASSVIGEGGYLPAKHWELNFAYRNFRSDRHFVGDDEQKQRAALHNEVINHSNLADIAATYAWTERLNLTFTLPFSWHDRSQVSSGVRYHTQAGGLGDVRLSANYWILDPAMAHRGNFSIGVGLKAPTGNAEVKDTFWRATGAIINYVDSSIQPGDGGWGATVEMQGFLHLVGNLSAYGNGFYLFNPEEQVKATGWSIPDGYMVRGGFDYRIEAVKGLVVSLGMRNEGVVAHDLFGSSLGRRRPGFAVAVEPGITYNRGAYTFTLTVPIAMHRNRVVSYGATTAGDAAFADYTINTGLTVRF
jgi:hypothetical protein